MPTVDLQDCRMHYEERGSGPPLLCMAGALGTGATDFAPQLESLSNEFRLIAPDPRGYGRSRPPRRDFTSNFLEQDARDAADLLDALGIEQCFVAGWSDGANSATLLAIARPELVRKLVVWGGNSFVEDEDVELYEFTRSIDVWSPRIRETLGAIYGDELQTLWSEWCDSMREIRSDGGEIYRERLDAVRCPTLILHGEHDPLVPPFHPRVIQEGIAGSRLHVFPGGRHNIHQRSADEFNQLVREFLS